MTAEPPPRTEPPPAGGLLSLHLGIFLLSLAVLGLEILQTRLFSLMLWHHVTYFVVTLALLGFAASGTAVTLVPWLHRGRVRAKAAAYALLFAVTGPGSLRLLAWLKPETLGDRPGSVQLGDLFLSYGYMLVPYLFAGLALLVLLKELAGRVGTLYAANLAGSGAGCFLFVAAITPLGGAGTTLVTAAVAALGAAALAWRDAGRSWRVAAPAVAGLLLLGLAAPEEVLPLPVAGSKLMSKELQITGRRIERTRWSPHCRIDVVPAGPEEKRVYQDGDAPTTIWSGRLAKTLAGQGYFESFFYGLAYLTRLGTRPEVLVIGPGGGVDVEHAVHFGARAVAAVEINPVTLAMVREEYREFTARDRERGVYELPGVEPVSAEGRAWLRRSDRRFDVIQMTGTDTYAALASGAYVFSESYLYTLEAFQEYLDHLREDGVVAVLRFRFEPPRESLKLAAIAAAALKSRGAADPGRHVVVVNIAQPLGPEHRRLFGIDRIRYAVTLVKRSPWRAEELAVYGEWAAEAGRRFADPGRSLGFHAELGWAPAAGGRPPAGLAEYRELFGHAAAGTEARFYAAYPYDVAPIDDDRPFFFKFHRWRDVLRRPAAGERIDYEALAGRDPIGLRVLLAVLMLVAAAVVVLVLLPLVLLRRRGAAAQGGRIFVYFGGIGLGFIFAEVASLQRFVLFLGHPTYSLTVVLFAFLVFMGLGSLASQRLPLHTNTSIRIPLAGVLALLALHALLLPALLRGLLGLPEAGRMAVAAAAIAPLAFLMGFAFPLGLRAADRAGPSLVPWAWAVNGAASVTGSVGAVLLAMGGGFSLVLGLAGACYLAALILAPRP